MLADPQIKEALVALVGELATDPHLVQSVSDMALGIIARNDIYNVSCASPHVNSSCCSVFLCLLSHSQATTELLVKSSAELLADETVRSDRFAGEGFR